jgi:hypothetical protein
MSLPPNDRLRFLVSAYAGLLAEHGEAFEGATLVTPTAEHFPDRFERTGPSVVRLLERVVSFSPLGEDVPLELALVEDTGEGPNADGHCSSGCAVPGARIDGVQRNGHGYRLPLPATELANPTRLVCALARGVGAAVLAEAEVPAEPEDVGALSEVAAAAFGFGIVLLEGSHVYAKSCGGPSIHQGTALSPGEAAVMLALFCAVSDDSPANDADAARKYLGTTQLEAFDEARDWLSANAALVAKLREAPELLCGGAFEIATKKPGLWTRLFGGKPQPAPGEPAATPRSGSARRQRSEEEERRLAEARALVEEELGG